MNTPDNGLGRPVDEAVELADRRNALQVQLDTLKKDMERESVNPDDAAKMEEIEKRIAELDEEISIKRGKKD
jgi:hypothetical protein